MGGQGSGRKPKKKNPVEMIEEGVSVAQQTAAQLPEPKPKKAEKPKEKKLTGEERKARKKTYPKPDEFKEHPLAFAINRFADGWAGTQGGIDPNTKKPVPGLAEKVMLGESYLAVADFYFGGRVDHPLAVALMATVQFGGVAIVIKSQQGQRGIGHGPGSPAGPQPPQMVVEDARCVICGNTFPDEKTVALHVTKDHQAGRA